ncbi:hypothetical protein NQ317_013913 [Molorchus minor]|uniref:Uncharacterized protein n=1 Tax=Molorchus minor TaxID=1323400 RepID=A0ABQ9K616_9CUCU|nr:hypothetical protein NQ317_013913 [Molorchus minor]
MKSAEPCVLPQNYPGASLSILSNKLTWRSIHLDAAFVRTSYLAFGHCGSRILYKILDCGWTHAIMTTENASRECLWNGTWSKSDYSPCKEIIAQFADIETQTMIYFIGYTLSLITLSIAIGIFTYFKVCKISSGAVKNSTGSVKNSTGSGKEKKSLQVLL